MRLRKMEKEECIEAIDKWVLGGAEAPPNLCISA